MEYIYVQTYGIYLCTDIWNIFMYRHIEYKHARKKASKIDEKLDLDK